MRMSACSTCCVRLFFLFAYWERVQASFLLSCFSRRLKDPWLLAVSTQDTASTAETQRSTCSHLQVRLCSVSENAAKPEGKKSGMTTQHVASHRIQEIPL